MDVVNYPDDYPYPAWSREYRGHYFDPPTVPIPVIAEPEPSFLRARIALVIAALARWQGA